MNYQTSESWNYTRYNDIIKIADMMDVPVKQSLVMRHNYLDTCIADLNMKIESDLEYIFICTDELEYRIYLESIANKMRQIKKLDASRPKKPVEGSITDQDIEQARQFPVNQLVEFKHGKATAFCHNDKSPSLYYASRLGLAICPVCDFKFNSIDVLVNRDGLSFTEAVKQLIGG